MSRWRTLPQLRHALGQRSLAELPGGARASLRGPSNDSARRRIGGIVASRDEYDVKGQAAGEGVSAATRLKILLGGTELDLPLEIAPRTTLLSMRTTTRRLNR